MREYGQIQCAYWQKAIEEEWSNDAMLLGAYLMTSHHSNGLGCYRLPTGYVADDLGWDAERVSEGFQELFDKGFCIRYGNVVLMPNFLSFNAISNGNVAKARQTEFEAIPNKEAKSAAARAMLEFGKYWTDDFRQRLETLSEGFPEGFGKQEPNRTDPNHIPPSDEGGVPGPAGDPVSDCPQQDIIAAYHEQLPMLPRVREWNDQRRKLLRSRWRESADRQSVEWWASWFAWIREQCPFLIGQGGSSGGREPFLADLEWLIRPTNFAKVIEGRYQRRDEVA